MLFLQVRENLIRLCEKINDGHYKITPDCAEYKVFEKWITDEQIAVMLALTSMKPSFVPLIARKAKMSVKRTREVLHEITDIGLVVQVIVPKVNLEIYLLPPYTPGIFEFLLINEKFCLAPRSLTRSSSTPPPARSSTAPTLPWAPASCASSPSRAPSPLTPSPSTMRSAASTLRTTRAT